MTRALAITALAVSLLALGVSVAALGREAEPAEVPETAGTTEPVKDEPEEESPAAPIKGFSGTGTHQVPDDVKPGTYRSEGNSGCSITTLRDFSGSVDSERTFDFGDGTRIVEVQDGDVAVKVADCKDFKPVDA